MIVTFGNSRLNDQRSEMKDAIINSEVSQKLSQGRARRVLNTEAFMKSAKGRMFMGLAVMAAMALTVMSVPAHAQSSAMSVKIPFAFHVGTATLPAGTYMVQKRAGAVMISDGEGHVAAVIANNVPNNASAGDWLVFNRYDKDCFLTEVRWNGYSNALRLIKSTFELELAKAGTSERALVAATR